MELAPVLRQKFWTQNGEPLAGGKLYSYEAGTSTPKVTYEDREGSIANTNPIILDANGECDVYLDEGSYKFVLTDADDVEQWTRDNIATLDEGALASAFYRDVVYINDTHSPYYVSQDDNGKLLSVNTTNGAVSVVLAEISTLSLPFNVAAKKTFGDNAVTVSRTGTDTIDGNTTKILATQNAAAQFIADADAAPDDWSSIDMGVVSDGAVTTAKLADRAVSAIKMKSKITLVDADYQILNDDDIIICDTSLGDIDLTLPPRSVYTGRGITIIKFGSDLNIAGYFGSGSDFVKGGSNFVAEEGQSVLLMPGEEGEWIQVAKSKPGFFVSSSESPVVSGFGTVNFADKRFAYDIIPTSVNKGIMHFNGRIRSTSPGASLASCQLPSGWRVDSARYVYSGVGPTLWPVGTVSFDSTDTAKSSRVLVDTATALDQIYFSARANNLSQFSAANGNAILTGSDTTFSFAGMIFVERT